MSSMLREARLVGHWPHAVAPGTMAPWLRPARRRARGRRHRRPRLPRRRARRPAQELGWDAGRADLLVGTSAGSIVAALLRAGCRRPTWPRATRQPLSGGRRRHRHGQARLPRPGPRGRPGRADGLAGPAGRAMRAPWRSAPARWRRLLPEGRVPTAHIAAPLDALYGDAWPAADVDRRRRARLRVAAGQPAGAGRAGVVRHPGLLRAGRDRRSRYVDGGVHSTTNADLVASERPTWCWSAPRCRRPWRRRAGPGTPCARSPGSRWPGGRRPARPGIPVVAFQPTAADLE